MASNSSRTSLPSRIESSSATHPSDEDQLLIAQIGQRRTELTQAAEVLQGPLHAINRAESIVRKVVPILPYAIAAIAVIGVASDVFGRRRIRPGLLIATGLNLWRLWNGANRAASLLTAGNVDDAAHITKSSLEKP